METKATLLENALKKGKKDNPELNDLNEEFTDKTENQENKDNSENQENQENKENSDNQKSINVTTVEVWAISPENVLQKDKKNQKEDLIITTELITVLNVTTVNNSDTWPKTVKPKKLKELKTPETRENVSHVKKLDIFPETVLKVKTERKIWNVTNATKKDISKEIAKTTDQNDQAGVLKWKTKFM